MAREGTVPAQHCVGWALPKAAESKPSPAERGGVLGSTSGTCPNPVHAPSASPRPRTLLRLLHRLRSAGRCSLKPGWPLCLTSPWMSARVQHETELSVFCPGDESALSAWCHLCPRLPSCTSHPGDAHCLQALSPQQLWGRSCVCPWQRTWSRTESGKSWQVYMQLGEKSP